MKDKCAYCRQPIGSFSLTSGGMRFHESCYSPAHVSDLLSKRIAAVEKTMEVVENENGRVIEKNRKLIQRVGYLEEALKRRDAFMQTITIDGQQLVVRAPIEAVLTMPAENLSLEDVERLKKNIRVLWSETVMPTERASYAVSESARILGVKHS